MTASRQRAIFLVSLIICGCLLLGAHRLNQSRVDIPEVVVEISEMGITVPTSVPSGIVAVVFRNTGQLVQSPGLLRLEEGVSFHEFKEAFSKGPQIALPLISLLGGHNIPAGGSLRIVWDLRAGSYLVVNFSGDPPAMASIEILPDHVSPASAPKADVLVDLQDFVFKMPLSVEAGLLTWEIVDTGVEWHEMSIVKLKEGMTGFDLLIALSSNDPSDLTPVYDEIFFWAAMSQGERAWVNVDLKPGSYIVLCNLPDFDDGLSHFHKGMVSRLEVR